MSPAAGRYSRTLASISAALFIAAPAAAQTAPQIRVVNYNIAQLYGSSIDLRKVFQAIGEDPTPGTGVVRAPDVYVFQEVPVGSVNTLKSYLDATAPIGVAYRLATFTINGGGGENALFYRDDALVEDPSAHRDITNHTGPRATDRWKLATIEDASVNFYIYSSHFKADTGSSNESMRLSEAGAVRRDADQLPPETPVIYSGDWNIYSPNEPAFLQFFGSGAGRAVDPRFGGLFTAITHTQSPHDGSNPELVAGGMDDRFDFQLCSEELDDGVGFDVIVESYRSFGNDGRHLNQPINSGSNTYFDSDEQWKADALAVASDHLPLVVDYAAPIARFTLDVPPLVAGLVATIAATDAAPGEMVYFIYSRHGLGMTPVPQLNVTLGLRSPALAGQDRADAEGYASIRGRVPVEMLGRDLWFQAARQGSVSDVVWRFVE